jgi:O-antigen biosynthesis protein
MFKNLKEYLLIYKSGLFDQNYYLSNNLDVRNADIDPLMHFIKFGWKEGRNPSEHFDIQFYQSKYSNVTQGNVNPLVHYINHGQKEGLEIIPEKQSTAFDLNGGNKINTDLDFLPPQNIYEINIRNFSSSLRPLNCYYSPHTGRRLNLITDSIDSESLFGGVATSIILATLIAERWGSDLRIITRYEPPDKSKFMEIIKINNINEPNNVEFMFMDCNNNNCELPIGDDEYILTTSWWTTHSALQSFNENRIIYIIQEDERKNYPFNDEYYLCSQALSNKKINYIVNSKLLYDYLVSEGLDNIKNQGEWFEPSFPKNLFYYDQHDSTIKKNFLFYAHPNNPRNLYYLGLRVINRALEAGLLDPNTWNINIADNGIEELPFLNSIIPNIYQKLPGNEYAKIIRKMDLGLCLMYSPHPGYHPLSLVASGAIVITNKYGNKQTLDNYSKNILCCDLNENSLVDGIKRGIEMNLDIGKRMINYENNGIFTEWKVSINNIFNAIDKIELYA